MMSLSDNEQIMRTYEKDTKRETLMEDVKHPKIKNDGQQYATHSITAHAGGFFMRQSNRKTDPGRGNIIIVDIYAEKHEIGICDDSRKDRETLVSLLNEYEKNNGKEFKIQSTIVEKHF